MASSWGDNENRTPGVLAVTLGAVLLAILLAVAVRVPEPPADAVERFTVCSVGDGFKLCDR